MADFIDLYHDSNWDEAPEYSEGTLKKILHDEDNYKIIALRLPEGFNMAPHSHIMSEQHIILSGEYESDGRVYHAGTYRSFHAHQKHGPFKSEKGALILVIWRT